MEASDDLLKGILADSPSPGTLFHVLSRMKEEGLLKQVIKECHKALDIYPRDIPLRRLLAETYIESARIADAESELNRVIALIDEFISSYALQAEVLIQQKRETEAAEILELYIAHRPNDVEAHRLLDTLRTPETISTESESDRKQEIPPQGSAEDEKLPEIATPTLAEIYFQQDRIQEALETYERLLVKNPDDVSSRKRLDELKALRDQEKDIRENERDRERGKK